MVEQKEEWRELQFVMSELTSMGVSTTMQKAGDVD